jgi:protein tyrosine/serine phosphatase
VTLLSRLWRRGAAAKRPGWDIADPSGRRRAWLHYHIADHGLLRRRWSNMDEVAPGVWRSNQPTHARFAALKAMGIRAVLNLRGPGLTPPFLFARESCEALGLTLVAVSLQARSAPRRDQVLALFEAFRTLERPFLMHCKSGADRAGFASALYVLAHEGASLAEARRHLSFRYLHVRASRTGILDHILDLYEARAAQAPIGIEDWFATEYDRAAAEASFRR